MEQKISIADRRAAFTLVELLVVIAIIALLMSILMPALGRVRKQAKTVLCQSNLKQWGICFAMYTDDWDGYFMAGFVQEPWPPNAYRDYWMEALRPCYGDAGDIRLCPMATKPGTELGLGEYGNGGGPFSAWGVFTAEWVYSTPGDYGSYGWNGFLANPPGIWGQQIVKNWRTANVKGTANILEAASEARVEKFVYLSTVGVMGKSKGKADENFPYNPITEYEKSKADAERFRYWADETKDVF